jgi:hypothetical protein
MGKVVDLINSVTGEWDEGIINDNFHPEDAKSILSISIGGNIEDSMACHFDPKGMFSVKSAYKLGVLLRDRKVGREASCSQESPSAIRERTNWKQIWQLKSPNKLKMFVWRLAHNNLAHRTWIQRLGVELDTSCPVCKRLDEDGGHIFLNCKKVKECWSRLGLGAMRESLLMCKNAHELLAKIWKGEKRDQLRASF